MSKKKQEASIGTREDEVVAEKKLDVNTDELRSKQIDELKEAVEGILQTFSVLQVENERNTAHNEALAEVKAVTKSLLSSGRTTTSYPKASIESNLINSKRNSCKCTSDNCCIFDLVVSQVRITSMQGLLEPADANIPLIPTNMEIRFFAHRADNGLGALIPGMFSYLSLGKPFLGGAAMWTNVNTKFAEIAVPHGTTKTVGVRFEAVELDQGLERVIGMQDERGEANSSIALNCCCDSSDVIVDLNFTAGGIGGGNRGSMEIKFTATRRCC